HEGHDDRSPSEGVFESNAHPASADQRGSEQGMDTPQRKDGGKGEKRHHEPAPMGPEYEGERELRCNTHDPEQGKQDCRCERNHEQEATQLCVIRSLGCKGWNGYLVYDRRDLTERRMRKCPGDRVWAECRWAAEAAQDKEVEVFNREIRETLSEHM